VAFVPEPVGGNTARRHPDNSAGDDITRPVFIVIDALPCREGDRRRSDCGHPWLVDLFGKCCCDRRYVRDVA